MTHETASNFSSTDGASALPKYALVVVPPESVLASLEETEDGPDGAKCSEKDQWHRTLEEMESMIESNFKPRRWLECKNLAKEILKNKEWCVFTDARYFQMKGRPETRVALMDFIEEVTKPYINRKDNPPVKKEYKLYKLYVDALRRRAVHPSLIKNQYIERVSLRKRHIQL